MKKLLFTLLFLSLAVKGYCAPTSAMSITPAAVDGATIEADDENTRNTIISSTYNAHDHNDIDQTANTLNIGDGAAGNKTIVAYTNDAVKPMIRYNDINQQWVMAIEGVTSSVIISGQDISFEGATADAYETQLNITDPTADRFQIIQNNNGMIALGNISNTLFFNTTGATDVIIPTSGTLLNELGAGKDIDIGAYELRAQTLEADVTTGTAPLTIASTTKVSNLNVDQVDNVSIACLTAGDIVYANDAYNLTALNKDADTNKYLRAGSTPTWFIPPNNSNVIFSFCLGGGSHVANTNGVVSTDAPLGNIDPALITAQVWAIKADDNTTYYTILNTKFKKIAGISTVTIYARMWTDSAAGGQQSNCKVSIGTANSNASGTAGQATPEWVTFDIDVSGLTNGTIYDVTIQIKNAGNANAARTVLADSFIGIGS